MTFIVNSFGSIVPANAASIRVFRVSNPLHVFEGISLFRVYSINAWGEFSFIIGSLPFSKKLMECIACFCPSIKLFFIQKVFSLIQVMFCLLNSYNSRFHVAIETHKKTIFGFLVFSARPIVNAFQIITSLFSAFFTGVFVHFKFLFAIMAFFHKQWLTLFLPMEQP